MRAFVLSSFMCLVVFSAGCAANTADEDIAGSEDQLRAVTITDADNGKTFSVEKGADFQVVLGSNPTTGYSWKVASTTKTLGYPSPKDGKFQPPGQGGPIGSGGRQIFTWKTTSSLLQPSTTAHAVTLEYRRSFEDASKPAAKTFSFKIKVKQGSTTTTTTAPSKPVTLFEEHDGSKVTAKVGQDVIVRLPENASTGYAWYVDSVDRTLGQPEKTTSAPAGGPVGGGGTAVFTWKTDGPLSKIGSHAVKLKYSRGATGTASKTFSFTVNVVAATDEGAFTCPPESMHSINCMPPTTSSYCAADYRAFATENCDVQYLD